MGDGQMKTFKQIREECWTGYKRVGGKMKDGRMVPNCVPMNEGEYHIPGDDSEEDLKNAAEAEKAGDKVSYHFHMANHHENRGRWHESRGRWHGANREFVKAEQHHELGVQHALGNIKETNQFHEDLRGLSRPPGRFAANITHRTDHETGEKVPDEYRNWVPPTGGKEGNSGRETWAVKDTVNKRNKRLGIGAEKKPETLKTIKKKPASTASSANFYDTYLSARPPRG